MRYIGSKINLLSQISDFITENVSADAESFCDIFSGTASVARYFKNNYKIISNDALYFSFVIQKAYIENNCLPPFDNLMPITDPFSCLQKCDMQDKYRHFIADNYSPKGKDNRMYFTENNANRIDIIRNTIEQWKNCSKITQAEYYCLLASLIEAVPFVSNITGTYGAYLKHWDKRAFKEIELLPPQIIDNNQKNEAYNEDAFDLIKRISGDILYIDPPYNARQYAPNYHILETIARYDNPILSGITGMRPYENQKSPFCIRNEVRDAFSDLIAKAQFRHIIVSYNSTGLMSKDFIADILKQSGISTSFAFKSIPYRKYKSKIHNSTSVEEYLFYVRKY